MEGRTTASFRCPCSDVAAPANHSFWVELVGLAGFPALLHGVLQGIWNCKKLQSQIQRNRIFTTAAGGPGRVAFANRPIN